MNKTTVAFLDSGIGGLPYLEWVRRQRPDLSLTYCADTAHFPYGELSEKQVKYAVVESAKRLFTHIEPAVLALVCNTASVIALDAVRSIAPCPVVGTVPAVKPAARGSSLHPIGLLATQGTVNAPYVDEMVGTFAGHREVIRVAAGDIVRYVEQDWLKEGHIGAYKIMERGLGILKSAQVESLVIGCTHFLHVLQPIREIMGDVALVDSRDGVGKRILSLLNPMDLGNGEGDFFVTDCSKNMDRYCSFAELFKLKWKGQLC